MPQRQPRTQKHFHGRTGCNQASKADDLHKLPWDPAILKYSPQSSVYDCRGPPCRDVRAKPIRSITGCESAVATRKKKNKKLVQRDLDVCVKQLMFHILYNAYQMWCEQVGEHDWFVTRELKAAYFNIYSGSQTIPLLPCKWSDVLVYVEKPECENRMEKMSSKALKAMWLVLRHFH